jgi:hypothetical protein
MRGRQIKGWIAGYRDHVRDNGLETIPGTGVRRFEAGYEEGQLAAAKDLAIRNRPDPFATQPESEVTR